MASVQAVDAGGAVRWTGAMVTAGAPVCGVRRVGRGGADGGGADGDGTGTGTGAGGTSAEADAAAVRVGPLTDA
ncbi:hypothetical protein GCM10009663_76600 [Kitasatospora arboriphila]|uniref:Uncharacterized protein n=1 Tax=Kitasatospora arboriphila TaxID=258052 RepID=A0ABP4ERF3_9ACTN